MLIREAAYEDRDKPVSSSIWKELIYLLGSRSEDIGCGEKPKRLIPAGSGEVPGRGRSGSLKAKCLRAMA